MRQLLCLFLLLGVLAASGQSTRVKWRQIIGGNKGEVAIVGADGNGRWTAPPYVDSVFLRNDSLIVLKHGVETAYNVPVGNNFFLDTLYSAEDLSTSITLFTHGATINNVVVVGEDGNGSGIRNFKTDGNYTTINYAHAPGGLIEFQLTGTGGDGHQSALRASVDRPIAAAAGQSPNTIKIDWGPIAHAGGYQLAYSYNNAAFVILATLPPDITTYTQDGLPPEKTVFYKVLAQGDDSAYSNSPFSAVVSGTSFPLPPLEEPDMHVSATTRTSITLAWNLVDNASGYQIDYSYDGNIWNTLVVTSETTTSYVHSGLLPGTAITYRIRAVGDGTDWSNSSSSTAVVTTTQAAALLAATTVSVDTKTANSVSISWDDVNDESGYEVQYSNDNVSFQPVDTMKADVTDFVHTNLSSNTKFYYKVRAIGDGINFLNAPFSAVVSTTTNSIPILAKPVPNAVSAGPTQINTTWGAITNATAYLLQFSPDNKNWTLIDEVQPNVLTYPLSGLEPSTKYYIRVQAVGDGTTHADSPFGLDSATTDQEGNTGGTSLATPTISATTVSSSSITATWTNVANESSYLLERSTDRVIWTTVATPAANVTSFTLTALSPSTTYYVRIQAIGNGTTFTNSGRTTANATTQANVSQIVTKHGVLLTAGSTTANITGAKNLGADYYRSAYNNGPANNNVPIAASGLKTFLNYNPAPPNVDNTVTLSTDTSNFACTLDSLLADDGQTNMVAIAIINEPNNFGYWNSSAANMVNMINACALVAHEHGLKAADGGITGPIMRFMVYEDYVKRGFQDSADDYKARAFPTGTNPAQWRTSSNNGPKIRFLDTLLLGMKNGPTDWINIHWYETVRDEDSLLSATNPLTFIQTARYLSRVTGKPVITNEYGLSNNKNIALMQQQVDVVTKALHLEYALWYSRPEGPLTNADGSLTPLGTAFKNKIANP